ITTVIEEGQPAQTIIEFAEEHDIDGIVLGTEGRSGVSRVLLGSVAETVAQQSPVTVTIVK
ncbi:universal stress protein, partial [Chryseobacterium gambrini]|uniref:universal stress protein n=1 Tax=Chryseobacterium gambrini TaxID=373672 RepID=UPI0025B59334